MNIKLFDYTFNPIFTSNTYVISDDFNNALIIDPGIEDDKVIDYILNSHLNPIAILLTHGHYDHIRGVDKLCSLFSLDVYIHELDEKYLKDINLNCSRLMNKTPVILKSDYKLIKDNDILTLLKDEPIVVMHTPFHTPGSVCFYFLKEKVLFSGDTLFNDSIGRSDLPGGDSSKIKESLSSLMELPPQTIVYPGHGPLTTIAVEKDSLYYLLNN